MRLSDFINKEQEKTAMQSIGKSELVAYLVNGLHSKIAEAAKRTYERVCADIAKKVAGGSRYITGHVSPDAWISASNLPSEFEKFGTKELREKIKKENDIRWSWSDMTGGDYIISFTKEVPTSQKYEAPTGFSLGGMRTLAAKIVKTCFWNAYEAELRKLLASEGISYEIKVAVIVNTKKKGDETREYIGFDEVCNFRYYQLFSNVHVRLALDLHYSYTHR